MMNIFDAFQEFDNSLTQKVKEYSGILGLPTTNKTVNVPDRHGYVYVRLRDNESEIIQVYNEEVSPVWNLPVIIVRQGGGWRIKGRDVERYSDWGSSSSFLPEHHYQHEFNRSQPGGDIVFVYSDQFVPLLVTPSGTNGGPNVLIQQYTFRKSDGYFSVVGGTGTQSLLPYRPTDGQARMALVYLNRDSGNHGLLINTGSSFAGNLTGTSDVLPYLPAIPSSSYEPLYGVRLVSGTQTIQWDNLYDLRQFYGGSASGSSGGGISEAPVDGKVYGRKDAGWTEVSGTGGGAGTPGGSDQDIQFNNAGSLGGEYDFHYDYTNNLLIIGSGSPPAFDAYGMHIMKDQGSPYLSLWAWQSNSSVSPYVVGYKARGTRAVPQAIEQFDDLFRIRVRGHNGVNYTASQGQLLFTAPYTWTSGSHPTHPSLWGTPSGSSTMTQFLELSEDGLYLRGDYTDIGALELEELSDGSTTLLHKHRYLLPFGVYIDIGPFVAGGGPYFPYTATVDRDISFVEWTQGVRISTTNNAANHWLIDLYKISDNTLLDSLNTAAISPNVWAQLNTTSFDIAFSTPTDVGVYIRCSSTGTPGNLFLAGPAFVIQDS